MELAVLNFILRTRPFIASSLVKMATQPKVSRVDDNSVDAAGDSLGMFYKISVLGRMFIFNLCLHL